MQQGELWNLGGDGCTLWGRWEECPKAVGSHSEL